MLACRSGAQRRYLNEDIKYGVRVKRTGTRLTPMVEFGLKEDNYDKKGNSKVREKPQMGGVIEGEGWGSGADVTCY